MPLLTDLIRAVPETLDIPPAVAMLPVSALTADSRQVRRGTVFAALKGEKVDGSQFIEKAAQAGAIAVLCDRDTRTDADIALIRSDNPRKALAHMAAAFYGQQPTHMVAVTGTDGKTSTADFFRQLCLLTGRRGASVGTLGVLAGTGDALYPGSHTTPDPVSLHHMLADMADQGIDHVCMEASSHGLHQHWLDGVSLQAGAFTNLARDHFDYHKTEENYFAAKARLFSELLPEGATAVLNQDDRRFAELSNLCRKRNLRVIGFGRGGDDYRVDALTPLPHGQTAQLMLNGKTHRLDIPLVGAFQVMNILAALGLAAATGIELQAALQAMPRLSGVPGRLELAVTLGNGAAIYVDYAHTPAALANILRTLRPHTQHRLHVVFGCGGDRDPGKRPEMGRVADELADTVIVTDDNPRSEDPALIRKAIMAACPRGKEVADRGQAIYLALKELSAGDILIIAGKGHEKTQTVGGEVYPFDDVQVAKESAKELRRV